MRTHNKPSCLKKIKMISILILLTLRYNNPHWLELSLSRTNFHGPIGVRATEVRLYMRFFFSTCDFSKRTVVISPKKSDFLAVQTFSVIAQV